jgi:hypothetical protein
MNIRKYLHSFFAGEMNQLINERCQCPPEVKRDMMAKHRDLKVAELEALAVLTTHPMNEASDYILGMMGKDALAEFLGRLRYIDARAADYLANAKPPVAAQSSVSYSAQGVDSELAVCKAYQSGRCVVQQRDTGVCTWDPAKWKSCNVVTENRKFYGTW